MFYSGVCVCVGGGKMDKWPLCVKFVQMYKYYWDIMTYSGEMSLIRWTIDHYVSIL